MKKVIVSIGIAATVVTASGAAHALTARTRQSPINIKTSQTTPKAANPIDLQLQNSASLDIVNTWDPAGPIAREWGTLKANVSPGTKAVMNGETYDLLQFHFHTPSEHEVNGKQAPMEVLSTPPLSRRGCVGVFPQLVPWVMF